MNMTTRLLMMAALALSAVSAGAQTPVRIDTPAFSMVNQWGDAPDTLLDDASGVTRIALNTVAASLATSTAHDQAGNFYGGLFEVSVHPGYRVTGFSLSGVFQGALNVPAYPDGTPGDGQAYNAGYLEFSAGSRPYGLFYGEYTQHVDMLHGAIPVAMASGAINLTSDFNLSLQGVVLVAAYPSVTPQYPDGIDSFASLRLVNPMLTIYTMAVPEAQVWAMLLGGLAVVGSAALRKKIRNVQDCQYDRSCQYFNVALTERT